MPRLSGTPLRLLTPKHCNTSTVSLQLFSPVPFSLTFLKLYVTDRRKLHTLQDRSLHLDASFSIRVFVGSKFFPSLVHNFSLTVSSTKASNVTPIVWVPQWAMASSFKRFLDQTQRRTTVGRTPLDVWSARRRDLYLTTHNNHNRKTSTSLAVFEPKVSAGELPQTFALDRATTGTGFIWVIVIIICITCD